MSESKILKRWSATSNYLGEDLSDYYVVTTFTRDSDVLSVANFIAIASYLMEIEPESERGWRIARFGHWACGYLYCVLVHKDSNLVKECEALAIAMREYPVLDEEILTECEDLIRQSVEDEEMLYEAPAAYYCESLLKPYL